MKKVLIAVAALGMLAGASVAVAGDAAAGKAAYASKGCSGCHGANAEGNDALKYPKLAGQAAGDIQTKLADYKSGKVVNGTMNAMAAMLSDADMANVAAYVSSLK